MGSASNSDPGSGSTTSPATSDSDSTQSTGTTPPALPIALKVNFTLNTPDGLRRIHFGLEKDTDGVTVDWTIAFTLYERRERTHDFGDPLVSLNVFVASKLHANAEIAATNGLTPAQTAHATGPAANAAAAVQAGTLPESVGNNIIQNTLQ